MLYTGNDSNKVKKEKAKLVKQQDNKTLNLHYYESHLGNWILDEALTVVTYETRIRRHECEIYYYFESMFYSDNNGLYSNETKTKKEWHFWYCFQKISGKKKDLK